MADKKDLMNRLNKVNSYLLTKLQENACLKVTMPKETYESNKDKLSGYPVLKGDNVELYTDDESCKSYGLTEYYYYGLAQFKGTEPDAQGYYNSEYTTNPYASGISINNRKTKVKSPRMKVTVNASTEASSIANKPAGAVSVMLPVKRVRNIQ